MGYLDRIGAKQAQAASSSGGYLTRIGAVPSSGQGYLARLASGQTVTPTQAPTLASSGKDTKYLSGNLLTDVVDVLSTPSYALAGLLQGKGVVRGVRERANWVDWLREKYPDQPWATLIGGTALNVLLDPLWVITPAKVAGAAAKIAEAGGVAGKVRAAVETSPLVARAERFTVPAFQTGIRPSTRETLKGFERITDKAFLEAAKLTEPAMRVAREISRQPVEVQNLVSRYIDAPGPMSLANLRRWRKQVMQEAARQGVNPALVKRLGDAAIAADEQVGKALVNAGLMDARTFNAWKGRHLRRVYERYEDMEKYIRDLEKVDPRAAAELRSTLANMGLVAARVKAPALEPRIPLGATMPRQDIPEAVRQNVLKEITGASYRLARGAQVGALAASRANMLREVAARFGSDAWRPGYLRMSDAKEWGDLAGKWVPEAIHSQLNEWARTPGQLERLSRWFVSQWKYGKLVLNPATHARNMLSNFLLADNAGLSPARVDIYARALVDLARNGPWIQEARQAGTAFVDTFIGRELPQFLDSIQKAPGNVWEKAAAALKRAGATAGDIYNLEEQWGKLALYIFKREQGLSPQEAAKAAEDWLFNYRKVPMWVNNLRSGRYGPLTIPFLTFSYKAIPAYARALWTNPARVARWGKYAQAVEEASAPEDVRQAEAKVQPKWMQKGFWLRLPIHDRYGRPLYLDLNYILPFADIFNASGLFGRGESPAFASMPINDLYQDLIRNQSRFTGRPIYPEGAPPEQKRMLVAQYVKDFLLPPLLGGYSWRKMVDTLRQTPDWQGRTMQLDITLAHVLAGLKTRPVDVQEERVNRLREIRQQLLNMRTNLIKVAQDPRMPNEDKWKVWEAGIEGMRRLVAEAAEIVQVKAPAPRPRLPHEAAK